MNIHLNKEQKRAMCHKDGPALILAVPGSGKTTTLIYRIINLISNHNVKPNKILSITFSKASAKDMKNKFKNYYKKIITSIPKFCTIHSLCYSIINNFANKNNINYRLIENLDIPLNKLYILKKIYYTINKEHITQEKLESLIIYICFIKNMMLDIDNFLKIHCIPIKNFKNIYISYQLFKNKHHFIDFDDMLTLSFEILKKDKDILNKYRKKYKYIQVDEGQDTSKIQIEIIKLISHPKNNLFVTADDDQSIYGFRGAFPKALINYKKFYPNAKIFFLQENFRSSKNIVYICNKFIKQNINRYNKNVFTKNKISKPITIIKANTKIEQYEYILDRLQKNRDYSNIAILYRNNISCIGLIDYLERYNIPFYLKNIKTDFFNHWIIKDIILFFNLSYNNTDTKSLQKIYFKMKGFIYKKYINYIKTLNCNISVFDRILKYPYLIKDSKQNIKELKIDFKRLAKLKPYEGINFIEKNLKYEKYLKENSLKFGYTYDSLKTILFNLKLISSTVENLNQFIGRLKYLKYLCYKSKHNKNCLTLSTIHSAKGLEFKKVYMIDLIDGDFPSDDSVELFKKNKIETLEEERRLFYVGMTRAIDELNLITVLHKNDKKVDISRFVKEIYYFLSQTYKQIQTIQLKK